jgi:hypothetical protein
MHARVSTVEVQPGKLDEVVSVSRDSVLRAARTQQGFEVVPARNAGRMDIPLHPVPPLR